MTKHGCLLLIVLILPLQSCLSSVWTGANLIYNRHSWYKKFNDYQLAHDTHRLLYQDQQLKQPGCHLEVAVFNGDVLLAGQVPSAEHHNLVVERVKQLQGKRSIYKQVAINSSDSSNLEDSWITAKIRSQMIADDDIDPVLFKIITVNKIVYIMGDVEVSQANRVLEIASNTDGVMRVVKLLHTYEIK